MNDGIIRDRGMYDKKGRRFKSRVFTWEPKTIDELVGDIESMTKEEKDVFLNGDWMGEATLKGDE